MLVSVIFHFQFRCVSDYAPVIIDFSSNLFYIQSFSNYYILYIIIHFPSSVEEYDPYRNEWKLIAPMKHARRAHGAASING